MVGIEQEKSALEHATAESRLMSDMMQYHERENRRLWAFLAAFVAALCVMAGCMVWAVQHTQEVANKAVINALETVAEMEVVGDTTTTVTQDTGEGGGNAIYQVGENATYMEGGGD